MRQGVHSRRGATCARTVLVRGVHMWCACGVFLYRVCCSPRDCQPWHPCVFLRCKQQRESCLMCACVCNNFLIAVQGMQSVSRVLYTTPWLLANIRVKLEMSIISTHKLAPVPFYRTHAATAVYYPIPGQGSTPVIFMETMMDLRALTKEHPRRSSR